MWLALLVCLFAAQDTTIRVPVRLVNLPALVVSHDGRLLPELQPANFRVLDNGRPQAIRLDAASAPLSIALAVQVNQQVRSYLPFIAKAGAVVESLLAGEGGEVAVLTYGDEVRVVKEFDTGDAQLALRRIRPTGDQLRSLDAASGAIGLLAKRPRSRSRILVLIGQPADAGSESELAAVRQLAEKENIAVYSLNLPLAGRSFVSDNFSLNGVSQAEKGGIRAGVNLGNLIAVLNRAAKSSAATDPFSVLTAATGGAQFHLRAQPQFESAIAAIGTQLRSSYVLSYYPIPADAGYHTVKVEVNVAGAKVYTRPGYWLNAD
jgi:VWFA-related protein